jgi:hypothetical protein
LPFKCSSFSDRPAIYLSPELGVITPFGFAEAIIGFAFSSFSWVMGEFTQGDAILII